MPDDKISIGIENSLGKMPSGPEKPYGPERGYEKPDLPESNPEGIRDNPESGIANGHIGEDPGKDIVAAGYVSGISKARKEKIEKILESDLGDMYQSLAPDKKQEFKAAGEDTAGKINELFDRAKVKAGKIIELIKKWLSMLPGINKFFVEQEAKIKTDEIMKLKNGSDRLIQ